MKIKLLLFLLLFTTLGFSQDFWTPKATGFSETNRGLQSICIVDDNIIWSSAYDGASPTPLNVRQFTKSNNAGNNWQSGNINLGTNQNLLNISSITAVSYTTAWVSAYSDNNTTVTGGVWKTTDGGTTWSKQTTGFFNTGNDSFCNFVHFFDINNGITQGDPASGYFEIYTTTDGGTNWTRVPSANIPTPLSGEYGYNNMFETVGDIIWFATNKGRLYKSTDKGLNWTVSQTPATDFGSSNNFARFTFKDATNGLLVKNNSTLHRSTDGGVTWTAVTTTGKLGARDICYVPDTNNIISIGTDSGNMNFTSYSMDNGVTWTEVMNGTQVVGLKFRNNTLGFGGGFATSFNNGGVFKFTSSVLGTEKFTPDHKVLMYPNPASDYVTISSENFISIKILTIDGKEVLFSKERTITVNNLNSGIYMVQINTENGNVETLKLIKK